MRYCYKNSNHHTDPAQSVPLKKRIMKRVDQSRDMTASNLTLDTALLPSKQRSTHLCKGHHEKEGQHKALHTYTHTQNRSTSCSVFLFYFTENITLLVVDINHYYFDPLDKGLSTIPDAYKAEMFVFQEITVQMGQCL